MSEIGMIGAGVAVQQALTQINISTAVMKNLLEADKQMAQLLENISKAAPQSNTAGGIDIYV